MPCHYYLQKPRLCICLVRISVCDGCSTCITCTCACECICRLRAPLADAQAARLSRRPLAPGTRPLEGRRPPTQTLGCTAGARRRRLGWCRRGPLARAGYRRSEQGRRGSTPRPHKVKGRTANCGRRVCPVEAPQSRWFEATLWVVSFPIGCKRLRAHLNLAGVYGLQRDHLCHPRVGLRHSKGGPAAVAAALGRAAAGHTRASGNADERGRRLHRREPLRPANGHAARSAARRASSDALQCNVLGERSCSGCCLRSN